MSIFYILHYLIFSFKNGSLTRERIRDSYAFGSWVEFTKLLHSTPRGNFGYIGKFSIDLFVLVAISILYTLSINSTPPTMY